RGAQTEDAAHIQALVAKKHAPRQHRGADRLSHAAPASKTLLIRAAERGSNLGSITGALLRLLDRYGAAELQAAIIEALDRNVPHPSGLSMTSTMAGSSSQFAIAGPKAVRNMRAPRAVASLLRASAPTVAPHLDHPTRSISGDH